MPHSVQHKELHVHLDPSLTKYWIQSENDVFPAPTEEEEDRIKAIAYQQVDEALVPYLAEGWQLDGSQKDAIFLERRIVEKPRYSLFTHDHFAAVVGARIRLRK